MLQENGTIHEQSKALTNMTTHLERAHSSHEACRKKRNPLVKSLFSGSNSSSAGTADVFKVPKFETGMLIMLRLCS